MSIYNANTSYETFEHFQRRLVEDYSCEYGVGDHEGVFCEEADEDAWVTCPKCGEPIYWCDVEDETYIACPACEFHDDSDFDEEDEDSDEDEDEDCEED